MQHNKPISVLGDVISSKLHNGSLLHELAELVIEYNDGWEQYVSYPIKDGMKYKRQLVSRNKDVDVVVISWNPDQFSGLHDHPSNGCIMHVVQGQLQEDVYIKETDTVFTLSKSNKIEAGQTSYIQGESGIHNIINSSTESVSIHVYSPPNYKLTYYNP